MNPTHYNNIAGCDVEFYDGDITKCKKCTKNCKYLEKLIKEKLQECGVKKRYINCSFKNIKPERIEQQQYAKIQDYAENIDENIKKGLGLIMKGPVGTGKTTYAMCILRYAVTKGYSGYIISMPSLMDKIFTLKEVNKADWVEFEKRIRSAKLMIIDDLGAEYNNNWVLNKVDSIISDRHDDLMSIIFTTNLLDKQLKETYAERIIDRFIGTCTMVNFKGESLRRYK